MLSIDINITRRKKLVSLKKTLAILSTKIIIKRATM